MSFMPDRSAGRQERGANTKPGAALFPPAGNVIEGDPVGSVSEADADAAEELFKGVYPRLAGWVRRLVDDDDTAHEIASEAFVRLLARWTTVDSPPSYLYMIATNLVRDHWRKTERERRGRARRPPPPAPPPRHRARRRRSGDLPGAGCRRAQPHRLAAAAAAGPVPAALLRGVRDPRGRDTAAPAGGHHQGRPVRRAGQAEDGAGGTRCLTGTIP